VEVLGLSASVLVVAVQYLTEESKRRNKMKVEKKGNQIFVTKQKGDPYIKSSDWNPDAESTLLYHVKKELNKKGYNLAKVRMAKDGHMVSDIQHYLRPLKENKDNSKNIYIYNPNWAIAGEEESFNKHGKAEFMIVPDIYEKRKAKPVRLPSQGTWNKCKKRKVRAKASKCR
jgi:hypothetical protein